MAAGAGAGAALAAGVDDFPIHDGASVTRQGRGPATGGVRGGVGRLKAFSMLVFREAGRPAVLRAVCILVAVGVVVDESSRLGQDLRRAGGKMNSDAGPRERFVRLIPLGGTSKLHIGDGFL